MYKGNNSGSRRIVLERKRQIREEGWTHGYDVSEHTPEELEKAAACYLLYPELPHIGVSVSLAEPVSESEEAPTKSVPYMWPFAAEWWKPGPTRERDLEKAGALCAAAIDLRMNLAAQANKP